MSARRHHAASSPLAIPDRAIAVGVHLQPGCDHRVRVQFLGTHQELLLTRGEAELLAAHLKEALAEMTIDDARPGQERMHAAFKGIEVMV